MIVQNRTASAIARHWETAAIALPFPPTDVPVTAYPGREACWNELGRAIELDLALARSQRTRPLAAASCLVPLCCDRHGTLHRIRRLRLHGQASEEIEVISSDGHDNPGSPACCDRTLHLLPKPIEVVLPKLVDLLVVLVLARLLFPESLPQLAEPRLDPSERQACWAIRRCGRLRLLEICSTDTSGLPLRKCLPPREGRLETVEAVAPRSLAPSEGRFEVAEPDSLRPPRHTHRDQYQYK